MYGYIRPVKGELKVRQFEQFKSCYCSLCHTLEKEYGIFARFILNYDYTFLAMLLWQDKGEPSYEFKRCIASPIKKKCSCVVNPPLELCAGHSVILAWWKLKDAVADENIIRSIPSRIGLLFLRKAYNKARNKHPNFDLKVRKNLCELHEIESSGIVSLDVAADKFALILCASAEDVINDTKARALEQLLYHTGRLIYILDAYDDLEEDRAAGRYNPIAVRFSMKEKLSKSDREALKTTLDHSQNLISAAFELLPENTWSEILRNIIYLGVPDTCARVLNGTWKKPQKRAPN